MGESASDLVPHLRVVKPPFGHGRSYQTGRDRVDPNSRRRVVNRGCLGQADHRMFCGDVGRHAGIGAEPRHGCRVHDCAAAGLGHLHQLVLEAEKDAGHVDAHDAVPVVFRLLSKRRGRRKQSRIVERNVERAEFGNCPRNQRLHLGVVGHVRLLECGFAAGRDDLARRVFRAGSTSPITTAARAAAKASAVARPIPVAAPVIRTVRPSKSISRRFI